MIRTFSCKHTEKLYRGERVPRFRAFAQQDEKRLQILERVIRDTPRIYGCHTILSAIQLTICQESHAS